VGKRGNGKGRGHLVRWRSGRGWWGAWHKFFVQATRTHLETRILQHTSWNSDTPGSVPNTSEEQSYVTSSYVDKLLPLLQTPKLIFQASKNSTNFCVDTKNQEQPILLGIGRKSIVGLKWKFFPKCYFWVFGSAVWLQDGFLKSGKNHINSSFWK